MWQVRCLNLAQYMTVAERVKEFFHNEGIHSTTIQPEFVETAETTGSISSTEDCMLSCPKPRTTDQGCDASKCCPAGIAGARNGSGSGQLPFPRCFKLLRQSCSNANVVIDGRSGETSPSADARRRPSSVSISCTMPGLQVGVATD